MYVDVRCVMLKIDKKYVVVMEISKTYGALCGSELSVCMGINLFFRHEYGLK